jgi:hypothetical protein
LVKHLSCVGAELSLIEAISGNRTGEAKNESETVFLNDKGGNKENIEELAATKQT